MLGARPLRRRQRERGTWRTKIRVPNTRPPQGLMTTASAGMTALCGEAAGHGTEVLSPGVILWSAVAVGPLPLDAFPLPHGATPPGLHDSLLGQTRRRGFDILGRNGATSYGSRPWCRHPRGGAARRAAVRPYVQPASRGGHARMGGPGGEAIVQAAWDALLSDGSFGLGSLAMQLDPVGEVIPPPWHGAAPRCPPRDRTERPKRASSRRSRAC
jgi:hypothetical protein